MSKPDLLHAYISSQSPTIGNILHLNKLLSTAGQLTAVKTLCIRIPDIEMVLCGALHFFWFGKAKQTI